MRNIGCIWQQDCDCPFFRLGLVFVVISVVFVAFLVRSAVHGTALGSPKVPPQLDDCPEIQLNRMIVPPTWRLEWFLSSGWWDCWASVSGGSNYCRHCCRRCGHRSLVTFCSPLCHENKWMSWRLIINNGALKGTRHQTEENVVDGYSGVVLPSCCNWTSISNLDLIY